MSCPGPPSWAGRPSGGDRGAARLDILRSIYQRCRRPCLAQPRILSRLGQRRLGDAVLSQPYLSACHSATECNNLKQLERVVNQLLRTSQ